MKRKIKISAIILLIVLIITFGLVGNYFYNQAVQRGTDIVLHTEEESLNRKASEDDQQHLQIAKDWFDQQEKDIIRLKADKEIDIQAQFIKQSEPKQKAVILAHGFRNTGEDMGKLAKFYFEQGFDVLLPDARGHGASEGNYIGFGWHDRLDYLQWIETLITYGEQQIILHGDSMGAATVLMTSGEVLPIEVKGMIADSSYSTVKEELAHQLKHIYNLPAFPLINITSIVTKIRAGYTFYEASVIDQVQKNTRPLFLIHGDADDLVPTNMAHQIYDAANSDKELWIVPDTGHTDAYENRTIEFENRIQEFLNRIIE